MKKIHLYIFTFFITTILQAQIVINEIDADNTGTDNYEFIELKSATPNIPLNGYVLVFYNGGTTGTTSTSYYTIDLDGFSTDVNGIIHFGCSLVSPTPAFITPNAQFQNGPDAVGLYLGDSTSFPYNTTAHATALIDAIAYTNSTTINPTTLMSVLNITSCLYDNQANGSTAKSIQRKNDGTYELKSPTPGANNDGSGIVINYLTTAINATTFTEGENATITFTTSQPVTTTDLTISFSLQNNTFNTSDYQGLTTVTIPVGSSTATTTIAFLNDAINDGDEEAKINIGTLPLEYTLNNNNIILRVYDINYIVEPFGTPLNPTYNVVVPQIPAGYYDSLNGLSGTALTQELQNIIANPNVVRAHSYGDIWEILRTADQNPENNNKVWLIYTEESRSKLDQQSGNSIVDKWNREHIYCQSRGNYGSLYDQNADGISNYALSNANDIGAGLSDAHHLRAVDGQANSSRGNKNYGTDYNGPAGSTTNAWKGDVARAIFYMTIRYNGLNVVNGNPADGTLGQIGDLSTLLNWHQIDARDDYEMNRNNYIYTWQKNRNPFIDLPQLVNYIWGNLAGQVFNLTLETDTIATDAYKVYPIPTHDFITISGISNPSIVEIYSIVGQKIVSKSIEETAQIDLSTFSKGIYILKIITDDGAVTEKKIILE